MHVGVKQKAAAVAIVALCASFTALAQSQKLTGQKLLQSCEHVEKLRRPDANGEILMHCLGFVMGVQQGFRLGEMTVDDRKPAAARRICVPDTASAEQLALVVLKWLREHPERLHEDAAISAMYAFFDAFRCRQ